MMEPPRALRISGMTAFVPRKTPLTFMAITRSHDINSLRRPTGQGNRN